MKYENLLAAALDASLRAGEAILRLPPRLQEVQWKQDHSPLTPADQASQKTILEIISKGPGSELPILSEEGPKFSFDERKGWESFWLVDPLDGTREFIRQSPEYSVNIALIERGRPVMGVIVAPALRTAYFGAEGIGSFKFEVNLSTFYPFNFSTLVTHSTRLQVKGSVAENEKLRVLASRSHLSAETRDYIGKLEKKRPVELVSAGSSLKFCRVAEGAADLYPRFSPTMEWDTAAGQALLESAGGEVLDYATGKPLAYNKENLTNPWFLAAAGELLKSLAAEE